MPSLRVVVIFVIVLKTESKRFQQCSSLSRRQRINSLVVYNQLNLSFIFHNLSRSIACSSHSNNGVAMQPETREFEPFHHWSTSPFGSLLSMVAVFLKMIYTVVFLVKEVTDEKKKTTNYLTISEYHRFSLRLCVHLKTQQFYCPPVNFLLC